MKFFFTIGKTHDMITGLAMARDIFMPAAQLWDKPDMGLPLTPTWLLGNMIERWKTQ